jgi:hypothetical protein
VLSTGCLNSSGDTHAKDSHTPEQHTTVKHELEARSRPRLGLLASRPNSAGHQRAVDNHATGRLRDPIIEMLEARTPVVGSLLDPCDGIFKTPRVSIGNFLRVARANAANKQRGCAWSA